jgi:hypothetical protein
MLGGLDVLSKYLEISTCEESKANDWIPVRRRKCS